MIKLTSWYTIKQRITCTFKHIYYWYFTYTLHSNLNAIECVFKKFKFKQVDVMFRSWLDVARNKINTVGYLKNQWLKYSVDVDTGFVNNQNPDGTSEWCNPNSTYKIYITLCSGNLYYSWISIATSYDLIGLLRWPQLNFEPHIFRFYKTSLELFWRDLNFKQIKIYMI